MNKLIPLIAIITLTGCSHVSEIGRVGDTVFFEVYSFEFFGPSHNSLISLKDGQKTPKVESSFSDEGIAADMIQSANSGLHYMKNENNNSNSNENSTNIDIDNTNKNTNKNSNNNSNSNKNSNSGGKSKSNRSGGGDGTNPGGGGNDNGTNNPGRGRK
jgi:uncharacterized membrane protein YgcG